MSKKRVLGVYESKSEYLIIIAPADWREGKAQPGSYDESGFTVFHYTLKGGLNELPLETGSSMTFSITPYEKAHLNPFSNAVLASHQFVATVRLVLADDREILIKFDSAFDEKSVCTVYSNDDIREYTQLGHDMWIKNRKFNAAAGILG